MMLLRRRTKGHGGLGTVAIHFLKVFLGVRADLDDGTRSNHGRNEFPLFAVLFQTHQKDFVLFLRPASSLCNLRTCEHRTNKKSSEREWAEGKRGLEKL